MTSVTFTPDVGGDNITIDDTDNPTTGLANGGHRTRFMIALQQLVKVSQWVKGTATTVLGYRDAAATSASQAQNYAAAAQAAAGAPAIAGKANKFLRVNPTETGVLWDDQKDWAADIQEAIKAHLPATIISIHSGSVASIPPTWKLCDGTNGTIDLRDKFILGAGSGAGVPAVGATGGAKTVALSEAQMPSHAHAGATNGAGGHGHSAWSDTQGWHQHGVGGDQPMAPTGSWSYRNAGGSGSVMSSGDGAHAHNIGVGAVGDHAHSFGTDYRGSGQAHENMPPYYALCFIQKVWA